MAWTPAAARFTVDGVTQRVGDTDIAGLKLPMNILLTIWFSSAAAWARPLDAANVPAFFGTNVRREMREAFSPWTDEWVASSSPTRGAAL